MRLHRLVHWFYDHLPSWVPLFFIEQEPVQRKCGRNWALGTHCKHCNMVSGIAEHHNGFFYERPDESWSIDWTSVYMDAIANGIDHGFLGSLKTFYGEE